MRKSITFVGSVAIAVSFDPDEFAGLGEAEAARQIENTVRAQHPSVDFWDGEFLRAAEDILAAR